MFWKKFFLVTFKQETNKRRSGRIRDFRFLSKLASFGTEVPLLKALEIGIIWQISGTCADIASLAHHVDSHVFGSRQNLDRLFFKSRSDVQTVMFWLLLIQVVDLIGLEERLDRQVWVLSSPSGQTSPVCSLTIPRTIPLNQTDQNSNSSNLLLCCQCPSAVS